MNTTEHSLETLQDIKRIMERSSRFISLSGWSGIAAGVCALIGAGLAYNELRYAIDADSGTLRRLSGLDDLEIHLIVIAAGVFLAAFISAFVFTYLRSKKAGIAIWGNSARRLMWNTVLPMIAGGFVILKMLQLELFGLIAPCCLIFYGLALVNGSKYTLGEVKYLGYGQIILGIINLWFPGHGLFFWAAGFGVLHIIYGAMMWWKYERNN